MLEFGIYTLVVLAVGFGLGRIHNRAKVEAEIATAVKKALETVQSGFKKI